MAEIVQIQRKIFGKNTFKNVVDINFNQLIPKESTAAVQPPATVETFFQDYNTLFYDIPASGSNNSHLELINKSSDYLGISFIDLQNEINNLRSENVALKNQIYTLTNPSTGSI
jgi:hypothetical protein